MCFSLFPRTARGLLAKIFVIQLLLIWTSLFLSIALYMNPQPLNDSISCVDDGAVPPPMGMATQPTRLEEAVCFFLQQNFCCKKFFSETRISNHQRYSTF